MTALGPPRQVGTFHSTQCICDIGTNNVKFCAWPSCGICAIIRSGFTAFEFGMKSNTGRSVEPNRVLLPRTALIQPADRFGSGVYSYLDPSLADRHAVSTTSSPYRVMLLCEVNLLPLRMKPPQFSAIVQSVSRRTYKPAVPSLIQPLDPQHEEGPSVYVSGAEAIVPKYLILYSKPSTPPSARPSSRMSTFG